MHACCWAAQRHDLEQDEDPAARSWHLEVILVRTCEHLLDAVAGLQDADAAWAGERPSAPQALDALQDALPALHDLRSRTWPDAAIYGCRPRCATCGGSWLPCACTSRHKEGGQCSRCRL